MQPGECVTLQPLDASKDRATLIARKQETYLLVDSMDNSQTIMKLEEVNEKLAAQYVLPAATKAELSVSEAATLRAREARQATAQRAEATRAAVNAATLEWYKQQARLAAKLGISQL